MGAYYELIYGVPLTCIDLATLLVHMAKMESTKFGMYIRNNKELEAKSCSTDRFVFKIVHNNFGYGIKDYDEDFRHMFRDAEQYFIHDIKTQYGCNFIVTRENTQYVAILGLTCKSFSSYDDNLDNTTSKLPSSSSSPFPSSISTSTTTATTTNTTSIIPDNLEQLLKLVFVDDSIITTLKSGYGLYLDVTSD